MRGCVKILFFLFFFFLQFIAHSGCAEFKSEYLIKYQTTPFVFHPGFQNNTQNQPLTQVQRENLLLNNERYNKLLKEAKDAALRGDAFLALANRTENDLLNMVDSSQIIYTRKLIDSYYKGAEKYRKIADTKFAQLKKLEKYILGEKDEADGKKTEKNKRDKQEKQSKQENVKSNIVSEKVLQNKKPDLEEKKEIVHAPESIISKKSSDKIQPEKIADSLVADDTTNMYFLLMSQKIMKVKKPVSLFFEMLDYFKSISPLLRILVILIIFFLLSIIGLFSFVLIKRSVEMRRVAKAKIIRNRYSEFIARYLYMPDDFEMPDHLRSQVSKPFYCEIFIDLILDLHSNITGEVGDRLIALYLDLGLAQYSLAKVYNKNWHIKAHGFREVAQMGIQDANHEILKFIKHKNIILRIESELALVKLHLDYPLHFLEKLDYQFTDWGQISVYDTLIFHNIEAPQFKEALNQKNDSILIFALRMIGLYKQAGAINEVINMLYHSNPEVRENAIIALKHLELQEAVEPLRNNFPRETQRNKIEILRTLEIIIDRTDLPFLESLLDDCDFRIRLEAACCLHRIGAEGDKLLDSKLKNCDEDFKRIVAHAKDDRI